MTRVGLLLAAGASRRFGAADKLRARFHGAPLATRAAEAMAAVPLEYRLVVAGTSEIATLCHGFEALEGAGPEAGQADSLRLGVARARDLGADRLLIALADMPLVTREMMVAVLDRCTDTLASAVTDGARRMPPACFPAASFDALLALTGDRGAGGLLAGLPAEALVTVPAASLADVDTQADLARLTTPEAGTPDLGESG